MKLLTESQAKFQSDQDYFRCPAVARGKPITKGPGIIRRSSMEVKVKRWNQSY